MTAPRDEIAELHAAEKTMRGLAELLGPQFPPGWGFALLVYNFGGGGYASHISNCERADLVKLLRECADKVEQRMDMPPGVLGVKE